MGCETALHCAVASALEDGQIDAPNNLKALIALDACMCFSVAKSRPPDLQTPWTGHISLLQACFNSWKPQYGLPSMVIGQLLSIGCFADVVTLTCRERRQREQLSAFKAEVVRLGNERFVCGVMSILSACDSLGGHLPSLPVHVGTRIVELALGLTICEMKAINASVHQCLPCSFHICTQGAWD